MEKQIASMYEIDFINKIIDYPIIGKENRKLFKTNNSILGEFLGPWDNASEINELLLPDIVDTLSGVVEEAENGSETVTILIYQTKTVFYTDNKSPISIPTEHLKQIIEAWRDFLLTPPFNGARI